MFPPSDRWYSPEHLWIHGVGNRLRLGITDHAQATLGQLVFVDIPEPGIQLATGHPFGVIESNKTVSELIAPLDGRVIATNEVLTDEPDTVNRSPYLEGWLLELEPADPETTSRLLDAAAYMGVIQG